MATLIIERKQDMVVEDVSFETVPATELVEVSYAEFASPMEAEIELMAAGTFPAPKDGPLIRIGKGILAFHDWLSGPLGRRSTLYTAESVTVEFGRPIRGNLTQAISPGGMAGQ